MRRDLEDTIQPYEVDVLALDLDRLHAVHGSDLLGPHVDRALHGRDGNRHGLGTDVHHERVGDGDGQRQTNAEAGAAPGLGLDLDLAAEAADVHPHDVHADAAARGGRHRRRRGQAGEEDQIEPRERLRRDEAAAPRGFAHGLHVDAAAVVRHLDVDRPTLVGGAEVDRTLGRLALAPAHVFGLDAVRDGVPHQVDQRIGHQLHDRRVHLDGFTPHLEHDILAGRPRAVPDHAHERREESADGHHAGAGDLAAQLAAEPLDSAGILADDPHQPGQLVLDLREVARDLAHPTREEVEVVVAVELELVEELSDRRRARLVRPAAVGSGGRRRTVGILRLELGDGLRHARLRERQELAGLLELSQMALEPASRDHELADEVHQRIEPIEAHANARAHPARRGVARRSAPVCAACDAFGRMWT